MEQREKFLSMTRKDFSNAQEFLLFVGKTHYNIPRGLLPGSDF